MEVDDIVKGLENKLQSDGAVDYIGLIEGYEAVGKIASIVLGLMVVFILIILPLVIALELLYINSPIIRGKIDEVIMPDGRYKKPSIGFNFKDARKAIERSSETGGESSANLQYLRIKIWALLVIVTMVAMVVSGSNLIIELLMKLISGILRVIYNVV